MNKTDSECDFEPITLEFFKKRTKAKNSRKSELLVLWMCSTFNILYICTKKTFQEVIVDSFEDSYCEGGDFGVQG